MILLAEHDEPSLAAKKKQRAVSSKRATSTPKNRVWNFCASPLGRPEVEPPLSWENATGSVQYSYETASGRGYYYTRDHLGSVREMCGSTGAIVARYSYDPYGRTTLVSGSNLATVQYADYYAHQPSGLLMPGNSPGFSGREYDSGTGRWLSRDAIAESGGVNLFGYCEDSPVDLSDPTGLRPAPAPPTPVKPPPTPIPPDPEPPPPIPWWRQLLWSMPSRMFMIITIPLTMTGDTPTVYNQEHCVKPVTCKIAAVYVGMHFYIERYVCSDGTWYDVTTGVPGNKGDKDPNPPAKEKRREGPPDPSTYPLSPHHN